MITVMMIIRIETILDVITKSRIKVRELVKTILHARDPPQ